MPDELAVLMHDDDKSQAAPRTGDILLANVLTCDCGIDTRCELHVKSSIGTSAPIDSPLCATGSSFVGGVFLKQFFTNIDEGPVVTIIRNAARQAGA